MQVVIRFLGLLEYYNSDFIAITIIFNNNLFNWWSDPKEVSKNEFSHILIFVNILHYANYGANNKMQLTLNELQKRSFKTTQCQKSWCGLTSGIRSCWSSKKVSSVMKIILIGTFVVWRTGLGYFYNKEFIW